MHFCTLYFVSTLSLDDKQYWKITDPTNLTTLPGHEVVPVSLRSKIVECQTCSGGGVIVKPGESRLTLTLHHDFFARTAA